jgi:hypothetical protein
VKGVSRQSTDANNSAPLITAHSAGNEPKKLGSRSAQAIASDDGASTSAKGGGGVVTAPISGNA